jgi:hypothetical protein
MEAERDDKRADQAAGQRDARAAHREAWHGLPVQAQDAPAFPDRSHYQQREDDPGDDQ